MSRFITASFVLIVLFLITISYSNIEYSLDKGDRFVYEIKYSVGDNNYIDYFEINIRDKYVADKTYFDIYARYYNSTSRITIAKDYKSISIWDLTRILSIADKSGGEFSGVMYVTIPVKDWNSRVSDDEPVGAKILHLKINRTVEKSIDIGGSLINILVTYLQGVIEGTSYEVLVDHYSGLLILLRAFRGDNELFSISLTYSTEYVAILQNNLGNMTEARSNRSLSQIVPVVLTVAISIIILMVIVSYLSRF